jgi:protein-disulfide isomerase-like protein with CxxC motif
MEITLHEDPACGWCWAFQPVTTAIEFELLGNSGRGNSGRKSVKLRRVMGGLSDRPTVEGSFLARSWLRAAEISGMPFDPEIWDRHLLRTTHEACRAVKAALPLGAEATARYLRRIREAFFVEGIAIDNQENLIELAKAAGLDSELIRENLANGRAEFFFDRDLQEASHVRFGFPTLLIRKHPNDTPVILQGIVSYTDVLQPLTRMGLAPTDRRRFADRPEDWTRLFAIHPRLALAEVRLVTGLEDDRLEASMARNGIRSEGAFLVRSGIPVQPVQTSPPPHAEILIEIHAGTDAEKTDAEKTDAEKPDGEKPEPEKAMAESTVAEKIIPEKTPAEETVAESAAPEKTLAEKLPAEVN